MRIPDKVTTGEPASADQFNALVDTLRELIESLGIPDDKGNDNTESPHAFWADLEWDGVSSMKAVFQHGHVRCEASGVAQFDVFATDLERVSLVASGDEFYVKIDTDVHGKVASVDWIKKTSTDDDLEETIHVPPFSGSGIPGVYYIKIVKFLESDGTLVPRYYHGDNIHWQPFGGEHVGSGAYLAKDYNFNRGRFRMRTITGHEPSEEPAVDVTVTPGDTIVVAAAPRGADGTFQVYGQCASNQFEAVGLVVENGMVKSIDNVAVAVGECNNAGGGDYPVEGYEELALSVCVAGVPTTKTFLVKV